MSLECHSTACVVSVTAPTSLSTSIIGLLVGTRADRRPGCSEDGPHPLKATGHVKRRTSNKAAPKSSRSPALAGLLYVATRHDDQTVRTFAACGPFCPCVVSY